MNYDEKAKGSALLNNSPPFKLFGWESLSGKAELYQNSPVLNPAYLYRLEQSDTVKQSTAATFNAVLPLLGAIVVWTTAFLYCYCDVRIWHCRNT